MQKDRDKKVNKIEIIKIEIIKTKKNKCFQHAVVVAFNHEDIKKDTIIHVRLLVWYIEFEKRKALKKR